mmetsp:Transcript_25168/g.77576  ORF Transcript_25168/g.77576 Transcript_25168/m.77576 type:complete len:251 (+) Transcript_25168:732-1484(+)
MAPGRVAAALLLLAHTNAFSRPSVRLARGRIAAPRAKPDADPVGQQIDAAAARMASASQIAAATIPSNRRALALWRVGWCSWWCQTVLTVVSGVVLAFARLGGPPATVDGLVYNGFFFSACGAGCGLASMAWTWRCARLARLEPADASAPALDAVLRRTRGALRAGVKLNLAGMALTLLSAEQVVGTLLAKALAAGPVWGLGAPGAGSAAAVQAFTAIDLYVIQANTNSLAAHFVSLLAGLALLARSDKW